MTIKGGIADILEKIDTGYLLLAHSGGLHHVQVPGQRLPKLFKKISMSLVFINIQEYKAHFQGTSQEIKAMIVGDLQKRLESQ